jgi:hypothetical protein
MVWRVCEMEELQKTYGKNENFVYRRIGDETVLVPIKDNVGDMGSIYNLNEVGAFIWERIDGRRRLTDIKEMMIAEYDVGSAQAEKDLLELIGQLEEIGSVFGENR